MNTFSSYLNPQTIPMSPSWESGEALSSPVCQQWESHISEHGWALQPDKPITMSFMARFEYHLNHWICVRKECRVITDSPFSFTVTTKLGGTDIKAPEATLKMHLNISWIVGSVSNNIMITTGSKEGPECLKADVFQITSFGLTEILLLPTHFSHLYYTCTLDTQILEKFKLNKMVSTSTGFLLQLLRPHPSILMSNAKIIALRFIPLPFTFFHTRQVQKKMKQT